MFIKVLTYLLTYLLVFRRSYP